MLSLASLALNTTYDSDVQERLIRSVDRHNHVAPLS